MGRSEPALVPEWLKSSGTATGGGSTNNHFASSSLQSDDRAMPKQARIRPSVSINDPDIGRSFDSDRTTSTYFRRSSSSNGSANLRSYGSFGRSHRDRDWEKDINDYRDKDRSVLGDHRRHDYSNPLGNTLPIRFEKDMLQRTQSMIAGKRGDTWSRNSAGDAKNVPKSNHSNGDVLIAGGNVPRNVNNSAFKQNFPSLGAEERQGGSELGRVLPAGLSTSIMGLKSALIDQPGIVGGSSISLAPSNETTAASPLPVAPSSLTGLNMAETLAQGPPRAHTPPQSSVGTQRLEELAIKQSRQLIPMKPSMSKTLVPSPSEKLKPKIGQQHGSNTANLTLRGGPARSDVQKTSLGKLQVLKPSRDLNGLSSTAKDSSSPTNGSKLVNSPLSAPPLAVGSTPLRTLNNNPNFSSAEHKQSSYLKTGEKRPTSQSQSRSDFFNLLKKKSSASSPSAVSDPGPVVSPSVSSSTDELVTEIGSAVVSSQGGDTTSLNAPLIDLSAASRVEITCNDDSCDGFQKVFINGEKHSDSDAILYPEEEEAAFLRSLGWEENAGEDEGLTEEEISAFYEEYLKSRPSSDLPHGVGSKISVPLNSQHSCSSGAPGSSSSDS